jgi:hypothetical protein
MEQWHPVTLTYLKQNLPDNLALQARIVLSPVHRLKPAKCAQICTGKRLFHNQIALRFGSKNGVGGDLLCTLLGCNWRLGSNRRAGRALMQWVCWMRWDLQCNGWRHSL